MAMRRLLLAAGAALLALSATTDAKLECRQPNYVTRDGKIFAQDPATPGSETEITIRGVAWSGMEKTNMIPDGLWGATTPNQLGVQGTKISKILEFFTNNSINSVRLPLNAQNLIANAMPQLAYIHGYDNKELTVWADANAVTYFDLIGRMIQTLQNNRVSVLLDIHSLADYPQDAYWYTAPYVNITQSPTYQAVSYVARAFCNTTYWNVLGIDLKDEMSDVKWSEAADKDVKTDWQGAAEILANRVLELCPQWLVFVGGASSPTDAQKFAVTADYKTLSSHWDGGNLHNATKSAMKVNVENKIVFAPHAHAHGKLPQNYFYSADSNCTKAGPTELYKFKNDQLETECMDYINGAKVKSKYSCTSTEFGCSKFKHLTNEQIATQYAAVLKEAIGDVVTEGKTPVIFGSFSGVYGADFQPHQTAALDFLVDYAATKLRGGYFWALNPDTEYFLEDSTNAGSGLFGKTHYGLFKAMSWQQPNEDLLTALKKLPSTTMPCYGNEKAGLESGGDGKSPAMQVKGASLLAVLGSALLAAFYTL